MKRATAQLDNGDWLELSSLYDTRATVVRAAQQGSWIQTFEGNWLNPRHIVQIGEVYYSEPKK